jgi:hypothetical protein
LRLLHFCLFYSLCLCHYLCDFLPENFMCDCDKSICRATKVIMTAFSLFSFLPLDYRLSMPFPFFLLSIVSDAMSPRTNLCIVHSTAQSLTPFHTHALTHIPQTHTRTRSHSCKHTHSNTHTRSTANVTAPSDRRGTRASSAAPLSTPPLSHTKVCFGSGITIAFGTTSTYHYE